MRVQYREKISETVSAKTVMRRWGMFTTLLWRCCKGFLRCQLKICCMIYLTEVDYLLYRLFAVWCIWRCCKGFFVVIYHFLYDIFDLFAIWYVRLKQLFWKRFGDAAKVSLLLLIICYMIIPNYDLFDWSRFFQIDWWNNFAGISKPTSEILRRRVQR